MNRQLIRPVIFLLAAIAALGACTFVFNPYGDYEPYEPTTEASGTLPVVSIITKYGKQVKSKREPVEALLYVDVPEGYVSFNGASALKPLADVPLTVKGRGNASWKLDKKPYKLRFSESTPLLGMKGNRHFALIPFAVGRLTWLGTAAGMEAARQLGMGWTPRLEPCELVMNGRYLGLYFAVETVRADKSRVDVRPGGSSDSPADCGWLVEIDNYSAPNQLTVAERPGEKLRLTYKEPGTLDRLQADWLAEQFAEMNHLIYSGEGWEEYIDLRSAARYFIVQELLHNTDGYNGSMYLHRRPGSDARWHFGPVWDLSMTAKRDWVMNDHPSDASVHWVKPMLKSAAFRRAVADEWARYLTLDAEVIAAAERLAALCAAADRLNGDLWPQYEDGDTDAKLALFRSTYAANRAWLTARFAAFP